MSVSAEFLDWISERLAPMGAIRTRRMFGGAGIYCEADFFAIVIDDTLYLKVDELDRPRYEAQGLAPFTYQAGCGRTTTLGYYPAPEAALDDDEALLDLARAARDVARRAAGGKRKPRRK
ncbi:MAG: TfoX/Sxy family protein [Chromatiales bacterium]|nr:TfoX/Sxy family protein [Chromatiales bacterium]